MNEPLTTLDCIAAPLLQDNINTDMIIPSREMKRVSKKGLSKGLFANLRSGEQNFILDQSPYDKASILISGDNFGCGSSREHAVWALHEFGFRAVIAQSFGSIFHDNCFANGIAPIVLGERDIDAIVTWVERGPAANRVTIDILEQTVNADGRTYSFNMNYDARQMLIDGTSPIDLTLKMRAAIDRFMQTDRQNRPWLHAANSRKDVA